VLAVLSVMLCSCTREVPLLISPFTPKLVLSSLVEVDSLIGLRVTRSYTLGEVMSESSVYDASVELRVNDVPCETRVNAPDQIDYDELVLATHLSAVRARPGDMISVKVSCAGYESVSAEVLVPAVPEILSCDTLVFYHMNEGNPRLRFLLRFRDETGVRNYYRVILECVEEVSVGRIVSIH
jgi:hypothetical protein